MLFIALVTSTKHYWVISAERRRPGKEQFANYLPTLGLAGRHDTQGR
jgi:hypothetical protein